tara:strand:- start:5648 stop:6118 length:471 start_codon:yes stop_codon:yes gene_type:complete
MADSVSKWKSGQNPTAGTPSVGFPYADFTWNGLDGAGSADDTNSHAALTSEVLDYPGRYFTLVINAGADTIGGTADVVYTLYGSNDRDLAIAKWDVVKTATLASATITDLVTFVEINTENDEAYYKYYKLKLDPSADVGPTCTIKVGVNAPAKNKG